MTNSTDEIWYAGGPVEGLEEAEVLAFDPSEINRWHTAVDFQPDPFTLGLEMQQATGKPAETVGKPVETVENLRETEENVIELSLERVSGRTAGYGRENSFSAIARRWNVWMENRGCDFRFSPRDVASLMVDFKLARKEARSTGGAGIHRDDIVDAIGYLGFEDEL